MPRVLVTKENAYVGMMVEASSRWRDSWSTVPFEGIGVIKKIDDTLCQIDFDTWKRWNCYLGKDLIVAEQVFPDRATMATQVDKLVQLSGFSNQRTGVVRDLVNFDIGRLSERMLHFHSITYQHPSASLQPHEAGPLWHVPDHLYIKLMSEVAMDAGTYPADTPASGSKIETIVSTYDTIFDTPSEESLIKNPIQQDGKKPNGSIVEIPTEAPTISTGKGRYPSSVQSPGGTPAVSVGHLSNRAVIGQGRI